MFLHLIFFSVEALHYTE